MRAPETSYNAHLGSNHLGQPILVQPHPIEPKRNPGGKARGAEMPPSVIALNSPVELSSRPQPFPIELARLGSRHLPWPILVKNHPIEIELKH